MRQFEREIHGAQIQEPGKSVRNLCDCERELTQFVEDGLKLSLGGLRRGGVLPRTYSTCSWSNKLGRAALSWNAEQDTARLRTPALLLQPRESMNLPPDESMKLAAIIPNGRMVLIDGSTPLGDPLGGLRAIESFLADLPTSAHASATETSSQTTPANAFLGGLSRREVDVLRLLAAGKSNAQIADELVISQNTVIRHVSNIFAKTGPANRMEAAGHARDHGFV